MKSILTAVARVAPRALAALLALAVLIGARGRFAAGWPRPARIFVLMVWDGLRPDMVTAGWTPNLFAIENEGVRFAHHHSAYPTVTTLNGPAAFAGRLFGFDTLAQQLRRAGGYLAILGKDGPTFVFDDSVTGEPAARGPITGQDYLFLSDKLGAPAPLEGEPGAAPPIRAGAGALSIARDAWF